jgi:hypothetical protein
LPVNIIFVVMLITSMFRYVLQHQFGVSSREVLPSFFSSG